MMFGIEPQHLQPEFAVWMCPDVLNEGMPVDVRVQIAIIGFRILVLPLIHMGHYGDTVTRKR
jgi:hypothetical protein